MPLGFCRFVRSVLRGLMRPPLSQQRIVGLLDNSPVPWPHFVEVVVVDGIKRKIMLSSWSRCVGVPESSRSEFNKTPGDIWQKSSKGMPRSSPHALSSISQGQRSPCNV